jgi:hypothetical protein
MHRDLWLDSNEFLSKSLLQHYVAETFLASIILSKNNKESTFWSDITSNPDGPTTNCFFVRVQKKE